MDASELIEKYNLREKSFTHKGFHGILHTFFPVQETCFDKFKEVYGDSTTFHAIFVKENYVSWYWNDEDLIRIRTSFIEKVNRNPNFLSNYLARWHSLVKLFDNAIEKVEQTNFAELSNEELLSLYSEFYNAYITEYGVAVVPQDGFSMHADRFFKPLLREHLQTLGKEDKLEEYYSTLVSPITESFISTEFKSRMLILKEIKKDHASVELFSKGKEEVLKVIENYPHINDLLEKHSKSFFWVENNYAKMDPITKETFIDKICVEIHLDPHKELKQLDELIFKARREKEKLVKELNLDKEFQNLIKIAEVFAYMQDERKKYVLISNHYQRLFLDEIGKRLGLSRREMDYTIFPELKEMLLENKIDKELLAKRYNGCLVFYSPDGYELIDGELAQNINEEIFSPKLDSNELKGSCASKGKAKGTVKIIKKIHDLANFHKGNILVSSMTRPEMVVAMKKAAAIVTDEGGITSHAAIVSRELGIPCIVGTQYATKILKDGDLVEVDANNGTVKKLKQ